MDKNIAWILMLQNEPIAILKSSHIKLAIQYLICVKWLLQPVSSHQIYHKMSYNNLYRVGQYHSKLGR